MLSPARKPGSSKFTAKRCKLSSGENPPITPKLSYPLDGGKISPKQSTMLAGSCHPGPIPGVFFPGDRYFFPRLTPRDPSHRSDGQREEAAGNGAREKDHGILLGNYQGLPKGLFEHRPQDQRQNKRGQLISELPQNISQQPEADHNPDVKYIGIGRIGSDGTHQENP